MGERFVFDLRDVLGQALQRSDGAAAEAVSSNLRDALRHSFKSGEAAAEFERTGFDLRDVLSHPLKRGEIVAKYEGTSTNNLDALAHPLERHKTFATREGRIANHLDAIVHPLKRSDGCAIGERITADLGHARTDGEARGGSVAGERPVKGDISFAIIFGPAVFSIDGVVEDRHGEKRREREREGGRDEKKKKILGCNDEEEEGGGGVRKEDVQFDKLVDSSQPPSSSLLPAPTACSFPIQNLVAFTLSRMSFAAPLE